MLILKFSNIELEDKKCIEELISIIGQKTKKHNVIVTTTAFNGINTTIEKAIVKASVSDSAYIEEFNKIEKIHFDLIDRTISYRNQTDIKAKVKIMLNQLEELLQGIYFLSDYSQKIKVRCIAYGERLSALILSRIIAEAKITNNFIDSKDIIKTNSDFELAKVDFEKTETEVLKHFADLRSNYVVSTGIGSNDQGEPTFLGIGGDDYCSCLIAKSMSADRVEIWSQQNGISTANPKLVDQAYTIKNLTYEEAMELSYFGNESFSPHAIHPLLKAGIPVLIKNRNCPNNEGTLISSTSDINNKSSIKGLSSVDNIALITLSGAGMHGMPYISKRLFKTLSENNINVLFISQASSEHSICVGIVDSKLILAKTAIEKEFQEEIVKNKINKVNTELGISIISIVGNGMRKHMGTAGKAFWVLGENGINIIAIAQGSTERNISFAVKTHNLKKSLNVIHENFFLSENKKIHMYFAGIGNVGHELLMQIKQQQDVLKKEHKLELVPIGLANSKKLLVDESSVQLDNIVEQVNSRGEEYDMDKFIAKMKNLNLRNSVFIDNTASSEICEYYKKILESNISIIASNKVAASSEYENYCDLKNTAQYKKVKYLYETNVAAGLPVIKTIQDLKSSGDKVLKIEAVLSGSLNFIFNTLSKDCSFSTAVKMAKEEGFTEPDARIDLSGVDVMRKILILARESGYQMNLADIEMKKFLPDTCFESGEWEDLYASLQTQDENFENIRKFSDEKNQKLRVMAILENGKAKVELVAVDSDNPSYNLNGKDNIVLITTERYNDFPLVVKGAGAGAKVTAMGVFADIMRFANN
jgi:aspartokinase/homoserine dehydrogenase 1